MIFMSFDDFAQSLVLEEERRKTLRLEQSLQELKPKLDRMPPTPAVVEKHEFMFSHRHTITTPAVTSKSTTNIRIPAAGEIVGWSAYVSDADSGDQLTLSHGGRVLISGLPVIEESDLGDDKMQPEQVDENDVLVVGYYNAGTTTKFVDWTFKMKTF